MIPPVIRKLPKPHLRKTVQLNVMHVFFPLTFIPPDVHPDILATDNNRWELTKFIIAQMKCIQDSHTT